MVTGPYVVVVFMEAELGMCNKTLTLEIELLTEDGDVVDIPGPAGAQAVRLEQPIIVPSPPGCRPGFPGHATAMMELPTGLPLGARYLPVAGEGQRQDGGRLVGPLLRGRASSAADVRVLAGRGAES